MNKLVYDVLIFGAGIIGLSLALRLARFGIRVIIVDHNNPNFIQNHSIPGIRVSAINYASVEFFKKIGIWKNIPLQFYTSYRYVETWEWPCSMVSFQSKDIGLPEMGCIIENNRLKLALWKSVEDSNIITLCCPSKLLFLKYTNIRWKCILDNNMIVYSHFLIGADGVNSQIRKQLGIGVIRWRYHQCCMLLTIKAEKFNHETIWQVFTSHGPVGFLPLYDQWGSLMWFDTPECIQELQNMPISMLERKIENNFYKKLGKITLYNTSVIPLVSQCANRYVSVRSALIGDAAHTIHPLLGQGINLGIRDVIKLSELLIFDNILSSSSNISENMLKSYQNYRYIDVYTMQFFVNCLYFVFNNNLFPLELARNITFMMVNKFFFLKKQMLKYATGV